MPRIPSYPLIGQISNDDLLIIDDVSQQYATKSVRLQSLKGYFNSGQSTTTYVDDKVVSGAAFNTNTGVLTLTRTDGVGVTQDLDGRYALTSSLAAVATSGSYSDLADKPTIPAAYTNANVDAHLNKDGQTQDGLVLSLSNNDYTWVAQSGGGGGGTVTSITTTAPITGGPITSEGAIGISQASTSTDGYLSFTDWNTFNSKSSFDGQYSSLTDAPSLATVATSGSYNDLINKPTLFSGSYNDLTDKPPTPAGYTDADVDTHLNRSSATSNQVLAWSGSDYDWVEQSGGISGTRQSTQTTAITEIKTLTQVQYDALTTKETDVMYVIL